MSYYYHQCHRYMNKEVQIRTRQGMYEGTIVNLDQEKVYLRMNSGHRDPNKAYTSWFFAPVIIPLVLFDLLAIVLLQPGFRRPFRRW